MKTIEKLALILFTVLMLSCTKNGHLCAQNCAQAIINDMTLPCDACAHGTEGLSWGGKCRGNPGFSGVTVPAKNFKGEWWHAMTSLGQVYIPCEGSSATNTRCQIRNVTTKFLKKDGKWYTVQSGAFGGAAYLENFADNKNIDAGARDESANGGGLSVVVGIGPWSGYNYHFYPSGRAVVDISNIVGIYTSCEARLILDDPKKPDDRPSCKNILNMGADWWLNETTGWLPDWSANSGIAGGRSKWVTAEWQTFSMCTLEPDKILINPPCGK